MKRRDFLKISGITVVGISALANSINATSKSELLPMNNKRLIDPDDRTLTIKVVNKSALPVRDVIIFGSVKDLTDASLNKNVTISVSESSHIKIKTELLESAIRIIGLKYEVDTFKQFNNKLNFIAEANREIITEPFYPLDYSPWKNLITTQIDAPLFKYLVTANTYIKFDIMGNETVTFTFLIKKISI